MLYILIKVSIDNHESSTYKQKQYTQKDFYQACVDTDDKITNRLKTMDFGFLKLKSFDCVLDGYVYEFKFIDTAKNRYSKYSKKQINNLKTQTMKSTLDKLDCSYIKNTNKEFSMDLKFFYEYYDKNNRKLFDFILSKENCAY